MTDPGRRILIVEDETAAASTLAEFLETFGYETRIADNGQEAIDLCEQDRFDLVLTDIRMPVLDGWHLVSRLQELCPQVPVVMMSGHAGPDVAVRKAELPVKALLMKPLDLREVLATVERLLAA